MINLCKKISGALSITLVLVCLTSCGHGAKTTAPVKPLRAFGGEEWLSWTSAEQNRYVFGYISGYQTGFAEACVDAEHHDLFNEKLRPGEGEENVVNVPEHRCLSNRREYSKSSFSQDSGADVKSYAEIITKTYQKYPDSRSAMYQLLIELLGDGQAITAEELYKAQQNKWPNARVE